MKKGEFSILGEKLYKLDKTAPVMTSFYPVNLEANAQIDQNLEITFDDVVTLNSSLNSTSSIFIKLASDDSVVFVYDLLDSEINLSGKTLIINPSIDLNYSTSYYVEIVSGVVKNTRDLSSQALTGNSAWSFTTDVAPVPALVVSAINGNSTEAGGTATFTVKLAAPPTSDVVLDIASDNTAEGTVSSASLTFTSANWNINQTITVTGINDDIDDDDVDFNITVAVNDGSSDDDYDAVADSIVVVTNTDDDTAGITVSSISGNTNESGTDATFTVVLDSEPTSDVDVPLSTTNSLEGDLVVFTLTFTNVNWDTPQTVTVYAADDSVVDGDRTHSILVNAATSVDVKYDGIDPANVTVVNEDDEVASLVVSAISGATSEAGTTATFTVSLGDQPATDVVLDITSGDTGEGTVSTSSLTFTNANWNSNQTVTVTGVDDSIIDGNISYNVTVSVNDGSSNNFYDSVSDSQVSVTNIDNDVASLTVSAISGATSETGSTATFTVKLGAEPSSDVVLGITSNDTGEGTVSPSSLTFTTANWNSNQTVTVTGIDDALTDGNITYNVTVAVNDGSSDDDFDGVANSQVAVTNNDDESSSSAVEEIFEASDGASNDRYGYSTGISSDMIIVGAPGKNTWEGAAYLYTYNRSTYTWDEEMLTASDGAASDRYGISVSVSDNKVLIGAYGKNSFEGAAYLYRYNPAAYTWDEEIITASNGLADDYFGYSVAISGSNALVGAYGRDTFLGAAYLYSYNSITHAWDEEILTASDGFGGYSYGYSVAISGNSALVGSPDMGDQGAAYLYQFNPTTHAWNETKFTASDYENFDYYGSSVAISGSSIVMGAYGRNSNEGAVYVYRYNSNTHAWVEEKITASDKAISDNFGYSVSLSGNTFVVGAYGNSTNEGSGYVYRFNSTTHNWDEVEKLSASDAVSGDYFGRSAAVYENTVLFGAFAKNTNEGAAYINYLEPLAISGESQLVASDGVAGDSFGFSTALSGDIVIVGAYGDDSNKGAAYIYRYNPTTYTWDEEKITASDGGASQLFGQSVALSENTALVGATNANSTKGAAYLYRYNATTFTWVEEILTASDGSNSDNFGYSVALSSNSALVGARFKNSGEGGAYLYRFNPTTYAWNETILNASDGVAGDNFGTSVAISGDTAIIGAQEQNSSEGAAYIYRYNPATHAWDEAILTASDGVGSEYFGSSVAISGNIALVGAVEDNSGRGAAYFYYYNSLTHTWDEEKIIASDGGVGEFFGAIVALEGNTAIIGAPAKNLDIGGAYIYHYNQATHAWDEEIIEASDGVGSDQFGRSVAISGDVHLVGTYSKDTNKGAVYLYR